MYFGTARCSLVKMDFVVFALLVMYLNAFGCTRLHLDEPKYNTCIHQGSERFVVMCYRMYLDAPEYMISMHPNAFGDKMHLGCEVV